MSAPGLPCICGTRSSGGSYKVGCPRCTAQALGQPSRVSSTSTEPVMRVHATATVATPVLHVDGEVWSSQQHRTCSHLHVPGSRALDEGARRLGRALAREIDAQRDFVAEQRELLDRLSEVGR